MSLLLYNLKMFLQAQTPLCLCQNSHHSFMYWQHKRGRPTESIEVKLSVTVVCHLSNYQKRNVTALNYPLLERRVQLNLEAAQALQVLHSFSMAPAGCHQHPPGIYIVCPPPSYWQCWSWLASLPIQAASSAQRLQSA